MTKRHYYLILFSTRLASDLPLLAMFYFLHASAVGEGRFYAMAANASLWLGFGFIHSCLARPWAKKMTSRVVGSDYVRIIYVVLSGLSLSVVLFLWQPLRGELWHASGWLYWLLTLTFLAAVGLAIACTFAVDYLEFLGLRVLKRKLESKPIRPPQFSIRGPYAYVRHPMYLALLGVFWFGPVMTFTRLEFAALATVYLLVGTVLEERNLRDELGPVYDSYRRAVPMWIPRTTPWRPSSTH